MHDWSLISIAFDWKTARATVVVSRWDPEASRSVQVEITSSAAVELNIRQYREWGPSVSILEHSGVMPVGDGMHRLDIQMQSGDVISLIAREITMPAGAG